MARSAASELSKEAGEGRCVWRDATRIQNHFRRFCNLIRLHERIANRFPLALYTIPMTQVLVIDSVVCERNRSPEEGHAQRMCTIL